MSEVIFDRPGRKSNSGISEICKIKAKTGKELEVMILNISSIDESECEKFGAFRDINYVRGSMQCDFVIRGARLENEAQCKGTVVSPRKGSAHSGVSERKKTKLAKVGSLAKGGGAQGKLDEDDDVRLSTVLNEENGLANLQNNEAKTNALMKDSENKLRRASQNLVDDAARKLISRDQNFVTGVPSSGQEANLAADEVEKYDEEAEVTLVSFLGSVDAKGSLSSIYVNGETKKLVLAFKKMKDDLELTTLTAMGRTYKERIGAMNMRLSFKWNQENLTEKCCNILVCLVFVFEEEVVYEHNLIRGDGCLELIRRISFAVGLLLLSEFLADYYLAKYAMQFCEIDMTQRFARGEMTGNLVFCLFLVATTYFVACVFVENKVEYGLQ